MTENMKKLLELASNNRELAEEFRDADKEKLIRLAKEQGIELTEADFEKSENELPDDELEAIAGGKCVCALGGGGEGNGYDKTCACVLGGAGKCRYGATRCACSIAGLGLDYYDECD